MVQSSKNKGPDSKTILTWYRGQ